MGKKTITFSAPGKVHLLGEHAVVYGKPALLAAVNLRVHVTISNSKKVISNYLPVHLEKWVKKVIEPIVKKHLKIKTIAPYFVSIFSQLPLGAGLGSSAAISASFIAALLTFLKIKWDLNLINDLTYQAEKVFHGNPSGADNSTVVFGGLIWYRKEIEDVKLIQQLPFSIPNKLAKNFILINTGKPKETTAKMVKSVKSLYDKKPKIVNQFLDKQENLVRQLLLTLKTDNTALMIRIIRAGEKNLESICVVSKQVLPIIREIEKAGGAAKICGGGGKTGPTGVLLCYHPIPSKLIQIAKSYNLDYLKISLSAEGLRKENV